MNAIDPTTPPPSVRTLADAPYRRGAAHAVSAPNLGTTLTRKWTALSAPDAGQIVLSVQPAKIDAQRRALHLTLLEAMGKDRSVAVKTWGRRSHIGLQTTAWLIAHPINRLVFLHSEWLHPALIGDAVLLAAQIPLRLTLVFSPGPTEGQLLSLSEWCLPTSDLSPNQALAEMEARTSQPGSNDTILFDGLLPSSDPFTFLSACQRLLPINQYLRVLAWYREYVAWAANRCPTEGTLREIGEWIWTSMMFVGRSNAEFTVFLRATQLVLAEHNVLLRLNFETLAAAANARPTRLNDDPAWRTIRGYRPPEQAATIVLSQLGLECRELTDLVVSDISIDGTHVAVNGDRITVPDQAALHLRALLAQHAQLGTAAHGRLLAGPSGPMGPDEVAWLITRGGHRHDLAVRNRRSTRNGSAPVLSRLRRYGIHLRDDR